MHVDRAGRFGVWRAAFALAIGLLGAHRAGAEATLSLAESTVRIERLAGGRGQIRLAVRGEGLSAVQMAARTVQVADLGGAEPGTRPLTASADPPVEVERGRASRLWLVTLGIDRFAPRARQRRFARLTLASMERLVTYTLTDVPPDDFTWRVGAPASPWLAWQGWRSDRRTTAVTVAATNGGVSGLRLSQVHLRETTPTRSVGLSELELCEDAAGTRCAGNFTVEPQSVRTFWLRLRGPDLPRGKYSGTVGFAVDERVEPQAVDVTIHASGFTSVVTGVLLLTFGTALGWLTNVWARARLARLHALAAVEAVRERWARLEERLGQCPDALVQLSERTRAQIAEAQSALTSAALDTLVLLPPQLPAAFKSESDRTAALQKHLAALTDQAAGLQRLVDRGMSPWWTRWMHAPAGSPLRDGLERALATLFFWGLGLPVALDRLQAVGPGGVAGSIGLHLPKATP